MLFRSLAAAALAALLAGPAAAAEDHHHHGADAATLTLDKGKKWTTDAALRRGMGDIREAMAGSLHAIHKGKLDAKQSATLAARIDASVEGIVRDCKLPPDADAQLHIVLGQVMTGSAALAKGDAAGAQQVAAALDAYGRHFRHKGWKPLH